MFTQQNWLLNRDFDRYVQDIREVEGTMSIQVIKKGKALTDSMIKNRPDIFKGDIVGVELISGNVTVETKGVVKKDGYLGRTAEVILDRTGKKVFGRLEFPEERTWWLWWSLPRRHVPSGSRTNFLQDLQGIY